MNKVIRKKLVLSKWTAMVPKNREKHFVVKNVVPRKDGVGAACVIEAVHSKHRFMIDCDDLKDSSRWLAGWC